MKLRDDDVFLCTYPKTGTHWLWEVCSMLRQGKADYDKRTKVQLMMEMVDLEVLDAQPSPRTLNTHLPFAMLPVQEMLDKRIKVVHVYRNIKDVIVSMYFMTKSGDFPMSELSIDEFVDRHVRGKVVYGGYFEYLTQMDDFQKANPDVQVFSLSYEDMKKDPVPIIRRLSEFLGVDASEQLCQNIAQACSFQKMKSYEDEKNKVNFSVPGESPASEQSTAPFALNKPVIYRRGEVGDWKNYLTVAISERVDAEVKEKMKGLPFTFQFM